jgi:hypothetical protein
MNLPSLRSKLPSWESMRTFRQKRVLIPVIGLALIASVVVGRERPSGAVSEPAARIDTRLQSSRAPAQDLDLDLSKLDRGADEAKTDSPPAVDPFARRTFAPAQDAPQAGATPASPTEAPPLPFTYLGKAIEDGKLEVFLSRGEKSYSVKAGLKRGQQIDDEYRVDKVTQGSVTFTYLPLNTTQTLDIPAVN